MVKNNMVPGVKNGQNNLVLGEKVLKNDLVPNESFTKKLFGSQRVYS